MFGKRKQPPPQQIQQYSDDESQPLIEEVDPDYQPTEKEVREYALDVLGMRLPEDQGLLYLAREGLKAPIPPNWVPYQSREGEIYYKHKITQEKTLDHPTDIEYKKKYDQQKEKMARKNLKSIGLKQQLGGIGGMAPLGKAPALSPFVSAALPGAGISNISSETAQLMDNQSSMTYAVDQALIQKYEQEIQQYQQKQERQWKNFQKQLQQEHERKMKKYKKQYEEQMDSLKKGNNVKNGTASMIQEHLQEQKKKIRKNFEEQNQESLRREIKMIEKEEEENKLQQYIGIFEEDNKIKLRKIEEELDGIYQDKSNKLQQKIRKHQQREEENRKKRMEVLEKYRKELEDIDFDGENGMQSSAVMGKQSKQLHKMLKNAIDHEMDNIQKSYKEKLDAKSQQFQHSLSQMKKILGIDKSQYLVALAAKKQKLKKISQNKIQSSKNKSMQQIQLQFQQNFQQDRKQLEKKLQREYENKYQAKKNEMQSKLTNEKQNLEKDYKERLCKDVQNLYQGCQLQRNLFEKNMNKKLSQIRMKFIDEINQQITNSQRSDHGSNLANRFLLQQKQSQIVNKQQLVKNLQKQRQLQMKELSCLQFDLEISREMQGNTDRVNNMLKKKMKQYNILNRYQQNNPEIQKYRRILQNYQTKYRDDKKILGEVMRKIQQTSVYSMNNGGSGIGGLTKTYNSDIRKLRENQDYIYELNKLITAVENQLAIQDGPHGDIDKIRVFITEHPYKEIQIRKQLGIYSHTHNSKGAIENKLTQIKQMSPIKNSQISSAVTNGATSIQSALRQHSKFLSSVKNQLNRKLYQVRYQTRY